MKTLTVREVPDEVYQALKGWAAQNNRSLQEQVRSILSREVRLIREGRMDDARRWRERLAGRDWGDVAAEIRRDRGR